MDPQRTATRDGKKFVWDGCPYARREDASDAIARYDQADFEAWLVDGDGAFFVYTRRPVKESAVTTP